MMNRLTAKKEDRYFENEEFWVSAEQPSEDEIDNVYFKLAEFEDFMEEQGFEDLESFRWALNFMKKLNSVGAKTLIENQKLNERWKKFKNSVECSAQFNNICADLFEEMKELERE